MGLKLEHVSYLYGTDTELLVRALDDVNLEIPDGQFIGLIGHTGSGKSTLVQHLNGLLKPSEGTILFNGENIWAQDYSRKTLRSKVGLVFQYPEHQLFETDVFADVCYGPKNLGLEQGEIERRAKKALELVGFPEEFFGQSPFELSGGQKRRVAIAGVLAMEPDILVLDEPTAGLDPKGRDEILGQISHLQKETGISVVLVSHSMEDVANYVERIIVMNKGKVMFDDIPHRVFSHVKELEAVGLAAPQGTHILHQLKAKGLDVDCRVKLVGTLAFIISLFVVNNVWGYLLAALFLALCIRLSNVPFKFMVKGMKSIVFLMLFAVVFNLFLTPGTPAVTIWKLKITWEGIEMASKMAVRLVMLIIGSSLMTLTTTPNHLTDGMEKGLAPLANKK